jgi:superfamily II DNA or RNA helicase
MTNMVTVTYGQTGESQSINALGMRTMQARAYDARNAQYLLVKAPPASGKSRALMFIALDKLENQGLRKVIVAVPERSIGASFRSTRLSAHGFFCDWDVDERWNLCNAGGNSGKVQAFQDFMASDDDEIIVCTHATLRFAYERMGASAFEASVVAIDEFHHVSADDDSRLGEVVRGLIENGRPHIVAMTGSYFRGDALPVLRADDEEKFTRVTYTYYEQLNGYRDLRSLGIGYHFYRGQYGEAIGEMLVPPIPKTIIHIPAVQSAAAYDDKYVQVDRILDHLGDFVEKNAETGIQTIRGKDGRILKVADLVTEDGRDKVVMALRDLASRDDMDIIIALGMAKEGFDWIWCEHALTVGYRGSLTEIIQIIGRATRDAPGKKHAQFTNLIAEPDATSEAVTGAVNNMLKAIACSLLMEQVLAPNFNFRTRREDDDITGARQTTDIIATGQADTIVIRGFHEPSSPRTQQIVESDLTDLTAKIMQDPAILRASVSPEEFSPEVINQVLIPRVIEREYPDLTSEQIEEVRQHVVANSAFRGSAIEIVPPDQNPPDADGNPQPDVRFIRMAGSFINIDDLDVDLIDSINPFQRAYEILSKSVTADVLKRIHEAITATRIAMSEEEAVMLWPRIKIFAQERAKEPSLTSPNPMEKRMAEALAFIREAARRKKAQTEAESA